MLKALTLSGSVRRGSCNAMLAALMARRLRERGAEVNQLNLRDYELPVFDEDLEAEGQPPAATELALLFAGADIIFIASPEYNAVVAPRTKNTIDWISRQKKRAFSRATFGLGAVSSGQLSGVVGLSHLRDVLSKLMALVAPTDLRIGPSDTAFDTDGELAQEAMRKRADLLADQLINIRRTPV